MNTFAHWLKKHWLVIFIIAILFGLFFSIQYFIHSVKESYSEGELHASYFYHHDSHDRPELQRAPQTLSVNDIQPWMTFDYINVVFKIPPAYLKNILGISDAQYPNIRLDRYAKAYHIENSVLLDTIRKYVTTYKATAH